VHTFHYGVVFNDADIDRSQVVWARDMGEAANAPLLDYYKDREVWRFNPDEQPLNLEPYPGKPFITSIGNAAGERDDPRQGVSPGGLAVIHGSFFGQAPANAGPATPLDTLPLKLVEANPTYGTVFESLNDGSGEADRGPVSSAPGNLEVDFGGVRAPILSAANLDGRECITVQVPFEVPVGWTSVTVRSGGTSSVKRRVRVLPATPGVFQMRMWDGKIRAVLLHEDGSLVDLDHPAHRGEVLHAMTTGLGPLAPNPATNMRGPRPAVSKVSYRLIIGVYHQGVPLVSAVYAPGMIGVEDVAFQIPAGTRTGPDIPFSVGAVVDGKTVYSNKSTLPIE
jgi:uncharacterized protein (TIGR03437 family)